MSSLSVKWRGLVSKLCRCIVCTFFFLAAAVAADGIITLGFLLIEFLFATLIWIKNRSRPVISSL